MTVLHVINGLHVGGAETALHRLLANEDRLRFQSSVFSLLGDGEIGRQMRNDGITTLNCDPGEGERVANSLFALIRYCRRTRPGIVQGWMYHGDLAATIAARIGGVPRHGWNIRHSIHDISRENPRSATLIRISARISRRPNWIVYNSRRAAAQHEAIGYDANRTVVIPNGFDVEVLKPDPGLRQKLRSAHDLGRWDFVVGTIGRYHPQKDYPAFVKAAAIVAAEVPSARFVGIGRGVEWSNALLVGEIERVGLRDKFRLLGEVAGGGRYACMFDVNVLASAFGEGFPNVVAEGMACGVTTVGTEVGDAAWVIGDTGRVVPPSNPAALAAGVIELACLSPEELRLLGQAARERVQSTFSIQKNVAAYAELYAGQE